MYSFCDGPRLSRWPYLGIATMCCVSSLVFVSLKASYFFSRLSTDRGAIDAALFIISVAMAVAHIIVAYRTSCRERRKLLVYKIDIEAVRSSFHSLRFFLRHSIRKLEIRRRVLRSFHVGDDAIKISRYISNLVQMCPTA